MLEDVKPSENELIVLSSRGGLWKVSNNSTSKVFIG